MVSSAYSAEKVATCLGHFRMSPSGNDTYQMNEGPLGEFKFYQKMAKKSGGPVLDLATGGGRMCVVLAKAGLTCVGMDASPHSLAIAKKAVAVLPAELKSNVSFIEGDMCDFSFPGCYPLIINAYESFWFILKMAALKDLRFDDDYWWPGNNAKEDTKVFRLIYQKAESCIRSITQTLVPRGKFIIDSPISNLLFPLWKKEDVKTWWLRMADSYGFSIEFTDYTDLSSDSYCGKDVYVHEHYRPQVLVGHMI